MKIGANVKCRYLYLPTIYKFDGKKLSRVDESSLVQLVHRAGRGSFPSASVYCSVEDYDYVSGLLFSDPRSGVPELNTSTLDDLARMHNEQGEKGIVAIFKSLFT